MERGQRLPRAAGPGVAARRGLGAARPCRAPGLALLSPSEGGGVLLSVLSALVCAGVRPPCLGEVAAFLFKKKKILAFLLPFPPAAAAWLRGELEKPR